jgi:hypothetical protein
MSDDWDLFNQPTLDETNAHWDHIHFSVRG